MKAIYKWASTALGICMLFTHSFAQSGQAFPNIITAHDSYLTDSISELDWLDITETKGQTVEEVSSRLGLGSDLYGWRFATRFEYAQLTMADALYNQPGFNYHTISSASGYHSTLFSYMYNTPAPHELGTAEYTPGITFGIKGTIVDPVDGTYLGLFYKEDYDIIISGQYTPTSSPTIDSDGFFLVRSSVPEPHAGVLIIVGLFLIWLRAKPLRNTRR